MFYFEYVLKFVSYTGCTLCRLLMIMDKKHGVLKKIKKTRFFILNDQFLNKNLNIFKQIVVPTSISTFFLQIMAIIIFLMDFYSGFL